jgi:hypothetical protein
VGGYLTAEEYERERGASMSKFAIGHCVKFCVAPKDELTSQCLKATLKGR